MYLWFCSNSLLVLKICFQVFSFASKKVQGFSGDRKILWRMLLLSVLFHQLSQFFEISIFGQDIQGNVHYVPGINVNSQVTLIKAFYLPRKTKEIWDIILQRQKIAEDNNAKINVSLNIFYIFLVFKASAFLQILFPKNLLFRQNLRTSVFLDSKCLTFLYLLFTKEHPLIA